MRRSRHHDQHCNDRRGPSGEARHSPINCLAECDLISGSVKYDPEPLGHRSPELVRDGRGLRSTWLISEGVKQW